MIYNADDIISYRNKYEQSLKDKLLLYMKLSDILHQSIQIKYLILYIYIYIYI
jgi:hypothetical protein